MTLTAHAQPHKGQQHEAIEWQSIPGGVIFVVLKLFYNDVFVELLPCSAAQLVSNIALDKLGSTPEHRHGSEDPAQSAWQSAHGLK